MVSQTLMVKNASGLHARPAGMFCEMASSFPCKVGVQRCDSPTEMDGKSILNILMGKITLGTEIRIFCEGEKEQEALDSLVRLVEGFTE